MSEVVPLTQSLQGASGLISRIDGDPKIARKLMSLGLRKGQRVSILHHRSNGVVVLNAGNRVAVGASIAQHVFLQMDSVNP